MPPKYFDFKILFLWSLLGIFATIIIKIGAQNTLDSRLYYSGIDAAKYINSLSDKEVYRYLTTEFFDLGLIFIYTIILFLTLKRIFYKVETIKYLALIPAALDFFETKTIIECLTNGKMSNHYYWLGYVTLFKWITGVILFVLIIIKLTVIFVRSKKAYK